MSQHDWNLHQRLERLEMALGFMPLPRETVSTSAIRGVARLVCEAAGVDIEDVLSRKRECAVLTVPRFAIAWLARNRLGCSFPEIGRAMGRDHSSVMHQVKRAEAMLAKDAEFLKLVDSVSLRLSGRPVA